jgi:hypothetical protein
VSPTGFQKGGGRVVVRIPRAVRSPRHGKNWGEHGRLPAVPEFLDGEQVHCRRRPRSAVGDFHDLEGDDFRRRVGLGAQSQRPADIRVSHRHAVYDFGIEALVLREKWNRLHGTHSMPLGCRPRRRQFTFEGRL